MRESKEFLKQNKNYKLFIDSNKMGKEQSKIKYYDGS